MFDNRSDSGGFITSRSRSKVSPVTSPDSRRVILGVRVDLGVINSKSIRRRLKYGSDKALRCWIDPIE